MNKRLINNTLNDSWLISYEWFISTQMDSIIYRTSCCDKFISISQHFFYKKEVMNSAQYHEEDFFVQVKNRDDKILPFH